MSSVRDLLLAKYQRIEIPFSGRWRRFGANLEQENPANFRVRRQRIRCLWTGGCASMAITSEGMPSEINYYSKIILNDNMPVEDSLSGREIQIIVGSPIEMAESALVEFASEFTRLTRMNQDWSTVHVTVEPISPGELPPLGPPAHTEGDVNAWIVG